MRLSPFRPAYAASRPDTVAIRTELEALGERPLISLVMPVYETDPRYLTEAIASVQRQHYASWELCAVDDGSKRAGTRRVLERASARDPRIRFQALERNTGIASASNAGLAMTRGDLVAFLDHDDALTPDALLRFALAFADPAADLAYSDQDKITPRGRRTDPFLKPDWSPVYALGAMYVGHLLVVRKRLLEEVGDLDPEFDGIQDFELMLRLSERARRIRHISRILYHWRAIPGSIAAGTEQKQGIGELQARAVSAHLRRRGIAAEAEPHPSIPHRARLQPLPSRRRPPVSAVVVARGRTDALARCLSALAERTSYPGLDITVVGRDETQLRRDTAPWAPDLVVYEGASHCPGRMANLGVERSRGEYLVILDEDTEVLESDWIDQLLMFAPMPGVGAVGPVLSRPNGVVEAAGFAVGLDDPVAPAMRGVSDDGDGYYGALACAREVSALSTDCLMIAAADFAEVGGFEAAFSRQFHDFDLCMTLRQRGLSSICTPSPRTLTHRPDSLRRRDFDVVDRALFADRWYEGLQAGDPYYNRAFSPGEASYLPVDANVDHASTVLEVVR